MGILGGAFCLFSNVLMCLLCITLIGNKFDIKDFHEVFLSLGPAPLSTLESEVNKYIESKQ